MEDRRLLLPSHIVERMRDIDGWLNDDEAELLIAATVRTLTTAGMPPTIVEIGSYCGKSTSVLAATVCALGRGDVYAIDPHDGRVGSDDDRGVFDTQPTLEIFERTIAGLGLAHVVHLVRQRSCDTDWRRPVGLLFIDGLHDYANVSRDYSHFEPWLADGSLIAFHDYADWAPGVMTCVDELIESGRVRLLHRAGSMALVERPAATNP